MSKQIIRFCRRWLRQGNRFTILTEDGDKHSSGADLYGAVRRERTLADASGCASGTGCGAPNFPDRDPIGFSSGKERDRVPGKAKRYTPEFKEQAARKVVDNSLPIAQVAREIGVNDTTLGFWVKDYRKKLAGQPLPPDMPDSERVRITELRAILTILYVYRAGVMLRSLCMSSVAVDSHELECPDSVLVDPLRGFLDVFLPFRRSRLITRLRSEARACGSSPAQAWQLSSRYAVSRT